MNLDDLIQKYPSLRYNDLKDKIICDWTCHEMPLRVDSVLSYLNGNKYKRIAQNNINNDQIKKFAQFLGPSPNPKRKFVN
jgi:hypothetical protein